MEEESKVPLKMRLQTILAGNLMVNIPVILVILSVAALFAYIDLSFNIGLIIGSGLGWLVWGKMLFQWKRWAIGRGLSREMIYKLGRWGLINFSKNKIYLD